MKRVGITLHWRDDARNPIPPVVMLELVSPDGDRASELLEPFEALKVAGDLLALALAALTETQSGMDLTPEQIAKRIEARNTIG